MKKETLIAVLLALLTGIGMWVFIGLPNVAVPQHVVMTDTTADDATEATLEETTDAYTIHSESPREGTPAALAARTYIINEVSRFKGEAVSAYNEYKTTKPEWPWRTYEQSLVSVRGESLAYDSYLVTHYEYTGGANGMEMVRAFTYDAVTGKQLSLNDVVPPHNQARLLHAVQADLKSQNGSAGIPDVFTDTIDALTFTDLQNFYINGGTLYVVFSEYDVAPGAFGAVRVMLPLSEYTTL